MPPPNDTFPSSIWNFDTAVAFTFSAVPVLTEVQQDFDAAAHSANARLAPATRYLVQRDTVIDQVIIKKLRLGKSSFSFQLLCVCA